MLKLPYVFEDEVGVLHDLLLLVQVSPFGWEAVNADGSELTYAQKVVMTKLDLDEMENYITEQIDLAEKEWEAEREAFRADMKLHRLQGS